MNSDFTILTEKQCVGETETAVDHFDLCIIGASLSGCHLASLFSFVYPQKTVILIEKKESVSSASDKMIPIAEHTPKLAKLISSLENIKFNANPLVTSTANMPLNIPPVPSTASADFSVRKPITMSLQNVSPHDTTRESWKQIITAVNTHMELAPSFQIKQTVADIFDKEELLNLGIPIYYIEGSTVAAVASRLLNLNPFCKQTVSENDVKERLVKPVFTNPANKLLVNALVKHVGNSCVQFDSNGKQCRISAQNIVICVGREDIGMIGGWGSGTHPAKTTTKRVLTCRVDAEFRFPRMRSWLREAGLLPLDLKFQGALSVKSFLTNRPDRDLVVEKRTIESEPKCLKSINPAHRVSLKRLNNTPAPPPSSWPSFMARVRKKHVRVCVSCNPDDENAALVSIYIDSCEEADKWLTLQKQKSSQAVKTAVSDLLKEMQSLSAGSYASPHPYWTRVVPVNSTVWRNSPGLPQPFLAELKSSRFFIAGKDFSTHHQGTAEGALQTAENIMSLFLSTFE